MKIKSYEFSIKEFGGAVGDFGTLLPFLIGYTAICRFDPLGLLVTLGVVKISVGLIYKIPLAVQPMKAIGAIALTGKLTQNQVCGAGIVSGIFWLFASMAGLVEKLEKITPDYVIIGVQVSLAILLGIKALAMTSQNIILSIFCLSIGLLLFKFKIFPASIALLGIGIAYSYYTRTFSPAEITFSLPAIKFTLPTLGDARKGLMAAGIVQIPLTLTNASLATASLSKKWFPDRRVRAKDLALNMGIINSTAPVAGGMPMCHGAGGFAAQYAFGARTGGAMIMQGTLFLFLGLFFSEGILIIFKAIPFPVLGTMLLIAAFYLSKGLKGITLQLAPILILSIIIVFSLITNLAVGYVLAMIIVLILKMRKNYYLRKA